MNKPRTSKSRELFRVWIASYDNWRPASWQEAPPVAVALAPAENDCFTAEEAAAYLEGFNTCVAEESPGLWAIAVPVVVRYDGDPLPGERIKPRRLRMPPR